MSYCRMCRHTTPHQIVTCHVCGGEMNSAEGVNFHGAIEDVLQDAANHGILRLYRYDTCHRIKLHTSMGEVIAEGEGHVSNEDAYKPGIRAVLRDTESMDVGRVGVAILLSQKPTGEVFQNLHWPFGVSYRPIQFYVTMSTEHLTDLFQT